MYLLLQTGCKTGQQTCINREWESTCTYLGTAVVPYQYHFWVEAQVWNRVGWFFLFLFWCALVSKWSFTSLIPCFAQDKARLNAVQQNLVGVPGIAMMHGHWWVHVLEKCVLYKNDPVYLDFLKVEGGTEGWLWALFFDALGTAVKGGVYGFAWAAPTANGGTGINGTKWFGVQPWRSTLLVCVHIIYATVKWCICEGVIRTLT